MAKFTSKDYTGLTSKLGILDYPSNRLRGAQEWCWEQKKLDWLAAGEKDQIMVLEQTIKKNYTGSFKAD